MTSPPVVAVLHADELPSPELLEPVEAQAELRYTDEGGLVEALHGADVLFAYHFLSTAVPEAWHAADKLQWLHVAAAGVDAMLSEEMRAGDITITNSRGVFDGAIAEYVLGQVLSMAKDFPGALRLQQDHIWRHSESQRVAGTRALVVGTGPIGRAIARLLHGVGIEVSGSGRRARESDPDFGTVHASTDLHAALGDVDWVVAAPPLTAQTRGMFDAAAFAAMRTEARFINVGRGELVVTDDLVAALRAGDVAGAALDVVDPEPLPENHPLWDMPGVVLTAHRAGDVFGWREELVSLFADNFTRWSASRPMRNVVDKQLGYVPSERS